MERCLRLLLSAAQRSKWGALFLILGVLGILFLLVLGLVSAIGNLILMTEAGPVISFLGNGAGVLVLAVVSIVFVLLGVASLWFLRPHAPQSEVNAEPKPENSTPQLTSTDTNAQQMQVAEIEAYKAEVASLEAQRDKLQDKVDAYNGDRSRLKTLLNDAYTEGVSLREGKPDWKAADEWAAAVSKLIWEAFGDNSVKVFMDDSEDRLAAGRNATKEQAWLDNRLHRLDKLRQTLAFRETVPFRSGFDPHKWKDWKSPPQDLPGEQDADQERPGYWENRILLYHALVDTLEAGLLYRSGSYGPSAIEVWRGRVNDLVEESLGPDEASRFLAGADNYAHKDANATEEQVRLGSQLAQLGNLIEKVDSLDSLELRPEFDGRRWVGQRHLD